MNQLIKDYLDKAKDDLNDAEFLFGAERHTASVTRAYYASWNAVQALLISKNVSPKTHLGTHVKFNELFIKTKVFPKDMSDKLSLLEELRETGDYEPDYRATFNQAATAIANASYILNAVLEYFK